MDNNLHIFDWQVYNILKEQTDWISQKELCLTILHKEYLNNYSPKTNRTLSLYNEYKAISEMSNEEFHNTEWRKRITNSIRKLNNSDVIQKIILSTDKGIKIANEEEYRHYIGRQINAAVRRLQRVKKMADKASRDGQMRITFNKERNYIEAFIKNYEAIQ